MRVCVSIFVLTIFTGVYVQVSGVFAEVMCGLWHSVSYMLPCMGFFYNTHKIINKTKLPLLIVLYDGS